MEREREKRIEREGGRDREDEKRSKFIQIVLF